MPSLLAVSTMSRSSLSELRVRVGVVEFAQELLLRELVAGGAVAADADAQDARPAAFALRLEDGVENRLAAAVQVAIGLELLVGQGVLRADVLAAAAFEHEPHADLGRAVLVKVDGGRAGADVGAVVLAGDRVHRVLPQEPFLRGELHGLARGLLEGELVEADAGNPRRR